MEQAFRRPFPANPVRLRLHALDCNPRNFLRKLAIPEPIEDRPRAKLMDKPINIGVRHLSIRSPIHVVDVDRIPMSDAATQFAPYGGVISPLTSQRSSQFCPSFHRKTWPLIKRELRSSAAIACISSSLSQSPLAARRFAV